MTPPKVPLTPYPWSSVMISSTLGAPLDGTTRGGNQVLESVASSLMTPPNGGGGGGSFLPSMVVVAPGEPSTPVTCCAATGGRTEEDDAHGKNVAVRTHTAPTLQIPRFMLFAPSCQRRTGDPNDSGRPDFTRLTSWLDPALLLEGHLQSICDLLHRPLGRALDRCSPRQLPLRFRGATHDETDRISRRGNHDERDGHTGRLASRGIDVARPEPAQPLVRHQVGFDRCIQMGRSRAEAEHDALGQAARVHGFEIAHDHDVTVQRPRLAGRLHRRQSHALDVRDQLLRDLCPQLVAHFDLLRRLRRRGLRVLTCGGGPGRDVGRGRSKVIHDDAIGTSDPFALVRLERGDAGRCAPGESDQGKHTCCDGCDTVTSHEHLLIKAWGDATCANRRFTWMVSGFIVRPY